MTELRLTRGDSAVLDIVVSDPVEGIVDISDSSLWWTVKVTVSQPDDRALFLKTRADAGIVVPDGAAGRAAVLIDAADWDETNIARIDFRVARSFPWDLQERDSAGRVTTLARGNVIVMPDVTVAAS